MPFYRYLLFEIYPGAEYVHPEIGNSVHSLMRLDVRTALSRTGRIDLHCSSF